MAKLDLQQQLLLVKEQHTFKIERTFYYKLVELKYVFYVWMVAKCRIMQTSNK